MTSYDAVVVGSGTIGLAAAWRLAASGRRVAVVDPHPGTGASYAAAGMLAPVTEASWGEEALTQLGVRSLAAWPGFAAALAAASGLDVGLRQGGTLLVAADASDRAYLDELLAYQLHCGLDASWCPASTCRELEPSLAPGIRGGILATGDAQVDNRRLLGSLAEAARRAGVVSVAAPATLATAAGSVSGVVAGAGPHVEELRAPLVVVAAGWASSALPGLPERVVPPVRPVKGQILRLVARRGDAEVTRTVRAVVHGVPVYLVPRGDGRYVLGATSEEQGTDTTVTAGAVYGLLRDAHRIVPGLGDFELVEARAGLRPGSPDNAPLVGPTALPGLVLATGHYRNGILLAPVTAEAVAALAETGEVPDWARPFDPRRFAADGAAVGAAVGAAP